MAKNNNPLAFIQNVSPVVQIGLLVGVGFLGYTLYNKIFGDSQKEKDKQKVIDTIIKNDLDTILTNQKPTYSLSNIALIAQTIYEALRYSGASDDDDVAIRNLAKMGNEADVYSLIKAFGLRQNYWFGLPVGDKQNLAEFVNYNLDYDQITDVNNVWAANGIQFRL
jgi:hypothetical protein